MSPLRRDDADGGGGAREPGVITFDGPAASGKSSVAQRVAVALGVPFVSSGLLYRAATHLVARSGTDAHDQAAVLELLGVHGVELRPDVAGNDVLVDGRSVTSELHTDLVDAIVSTVAGHPGVRAWVSEQLQRVPAPFAIDGRDMGSVVFPRARHKFYLTASAQERARRRVGERAADLAAVAEAIARRDEGDARQLAPAADAVHIGTDGLDLDHVVERVLAVIRASDAGAPASDERAAAS